MPDREDISIFEFEDIQINDTVSEMNDEKKEKVEEDENKNTDEPDKDNDNLVVHDNSN